MSNKTDSINETNNPEFKLAANMLAYKFAEGEIAEGLAEEILECMEFAFLKGKAEKAN